MEDIVNSPWWNVLTVVVTALTIIAMFIIFFLGRQRKRLSYDIISNVPILRHHNVQGKLEILFEGNLVNGS